MSNIDRSHPVPIYYQLKNLIQQRIDNGDWKAGDQIPTEEELCDYYQISRTPVRQALLELTREGVLTRAVGRGTFVAAKTEETCTLRVTLPDSRWARPLKEACRLWNEAHPAQHLQIEYTTVPLSDLHDHLTLAVAQGQAPDISILDSVWIAEFAYRRYLRALNELDAAWVTEICDKFYPPLLMANSYKGELYGIQTNADTAVLWYRRDWLESEELSPPTTWDELAAIGRHFRRSDVRRRYGTGVYPFTFVGGRAGGETTTYQLLPLIRSAGGDLIAHGQVVLDSEATRQALEFIKRLVHSEQIADPDVVNQPWDGSLKAFARGQVALAFGGTYENFLIQNAASWDADTFLKHVGFVPIPAAPGCDPATLVGGMTYVINRQSKLATEALALLKLTLLPAILLPFSQETGQNPGLVSLAADIQANENTFLSRTAPLLAKAHNRPSLPAYDRISAQLQEMVELSLTGQMSVREAVRRASERISGITGLPIH